MSYRAPSRRQFALRAVADALEADGWYLADMLQDYNDPKNPVTVSEIISLLREEARRES